MAENEQSRQQGNPTPEENSEHQEAAITEVGGRALSDALKVSFTFLRLAMIILVLLYVLSGIFYVKPEEVKIKLRFGRPVKVGGKYVIDSTSGWHIRWPWEDLVSIPISEQSFVIEEPLWYWRSALAAETHRAEKLRASLQGYLITGDVNIVHMKLKVRYRARSDEQGALDYAFRMENPRQLIKRLTIRSAIKVVGRQRVMRVLTEGKREVRGRIEEELRRRLKHFEKENAFSAGVEIASVEFIDGPNVIIDVQDAFHDAQQAASEMKEMVREAEAEAEKILGEAEQARARVLARAHAYKKRLEYIARADAGTLQRLTGAYRESPEMGAILRERHYQRVVEHLLGMADMSFLLHSPDEGRSREIRLLIGQQPQKKKAMKPEEYYKDGRLTLPEGAKPVPE